MYKELLIKYNNSKFKNKLSDIELASAVKAYFGDHPEFELICEMVSNIDLDHHDTKYDTYWMKCGLLAEYCEYDDYETFEEMYNKCDYNAGINRMLNRYESEEHYSEFDYR